MNNEMVLNSTQSAFDKGVQRLIQENKTLTAENAALKRVAEAVMEFNWSSGLESVRAWNAVKAAMAASGYDVTKEHLL